MWALVQVLADPLPIQLSADGAGDAKEDGSRPRAPECTLETWNNLLVLDFWLLLVLPWLLNHLETESMTLDLCVSLPVTYIGACLIGMGLAV